MLEIGECCIMVALEKCCINIEELRMRIKINNVAKIYDADILLKGITVIAGSNSTGKSTILKSIYIGLNTFKNAEGKIAYERRRSIKTILYRMEDYFDENGYSDLPESILEDLAYLLSENMEVFLENPDNYDFFKELFCKTVLSYEEYFEEVNEEELFSEDFLSNIFEKVKEVFSRTRKEYLIYISELYLRNVFNNQFSNSQNNMDSSIQISTENVENHIVVVNNRIKEISDNGLGGPDVIYFPTYNILDYINGNKVLRANYSIENDFRNNLSGNNNNQSLEEHREVENNIDLLKEILEEVVHGELERTPFGELRYKDNDTGNSYSTRNVASGIKIFLLIQSLVERGVLKRNSILLIDEPETNLHPEWHLIFAEILVLMYKHMGVISVVNSHSPYFIRALEVKMADHEVADMGTYYLMEEKKKNSYVATDVSHETNKIYEKLYKPLEYL